MSEEVGRPRIAIVGLWIESSTWAAHRAGTRDFTVHEGAELLARYPFLVGEDAPLRRAAAWIGVLHARSLPGGTVEPAVYDGLRARIVDGPARAHADAPLAGIYLDVHGAMGIAGRDDAEGDLVEAIREVVGPGPLIAAPMDLHGDLSARFVAAVDLPTCYRTAPHVDVEETRERSARHLLEWIGRGGRPYRARVVVPMLLAGEQSSTRVEPARSLYREVGARVDHRVSGPVRMRGELLSRHDGDPDVGRIVVVRRGGLHLVLTEHRTAFHATDDVTAIGLDPAAADVIITKIGYLEPTLHDLAGGWTLALTPGPVDQDLHRLGRRRIRRPMHPFDAFDADPVLQMELR